MKALDTLVVQSAKHERLIEIVGGLWFAISCADYAHFINLPEIPLLTDRAAIFVSLGVNMVWWSFLRPLVERRKTTLLATSDTRATHG